MKRASTGAAATGPAKQRRRSIAAGGSSPALQKCAVVAKTLMEADAAVLPNAVRQMLTPMAEVSLTTPQKERHHFQVSIVRMIGQALSDIFSHTKEALGEAKAKVNTVYDDRAARQEALEQAKAALAGHEEVFASKKKALAAASEASSKGAKELSDVQKAQKAADRGSVAVEAQKAEVNEARASLAALKASNDGGKESKQAAKLVSATAKNFGVDASLMDSLPQALRKESAARSDFDTVVLDQLEQTFAKLVAGFDETLAAAAPAREERAKATQAAQEAADAAERVRQECELEHNMAQEAAKTGLAAVKASHKAVDRWLNDTKVTMDTFDALAAQLAKLSEGPLKAFEELKELAPEPGPAEPAEEPAEEEAAEEQLADHSAEVADVA